MLRKDPERAEKLRRYYRERFEKLRLKTLMFLSKGTPKCENCGCEDIRILEINHRIPCLGKRLQSWQLFPLILKGALPRKDFNVLCRPCNIVHFLSWKYNLQWEIRFRKHS